MNILLCNVVITVDFPFIIELILAVLCCLEEARLVLCLHFDLVSVVIDQLVACLRESWRYNPLLTDTLPRFLFVVGLSGLLSGHMHLYYLLEGLLAVVRL